MTKRFLIVGDNHLDSKTPQSRLDNYMESSLMQLKETLLIAEEKKVDYYILLGDVFNRIDVGGECRNRALDAFFSNQGNPWSFKKYVVVGNHDIAHNPSNIKKSALQTLISANVIFKEDTIDGLPVRFLHFTPDLDERLRKGELKQYKDVIYFAHASVMDQPSRFEHILFDDLPLNDECKIFCSGHIHAPMKRERKSGSWFFNPGCLGRTDITENHDPQVMLLDFDFNDLNFTNTYIELKSELKFDVIFDLERSNKRKEEQKNTELFIKSVTEMAIEDTSSGDIETDLVNFANTKKISENVVKKALEAINIIKAGGELL